MATWLRHPASPNPERWTRERSWHCVQLVSTIDLPGPSGSGTWATAAVLKATASSNGVRFMVSLPKQWNVPGGTARLHRREIRVHVGEVLVAHVLLRIARHHRARVPHLLLETFPRK